MAEEIENLEQLSLESLGDSDDLDFLASTQEDTTSEEEQEESSEENNDIVDDPNVEATEEEAEAEEENVVDEETPEEGTPSKDFSKTLSFFASALAEEGVLTSLDKDTKIESFDDLKEVVLKTIKDNEFAGLNERQKNYLKTLELGLPEDEFIKSEKQFEDLSKITKETLEDREDLRKQLITEDFLSKGFNKEKAEKLAQMSIDSGTDVEDAMDALEAKRSTIKKQQEQQVAQRKAEIESAKKQQSELNNKIKSIVFDEKKEIIPGFKYNSKVAEKTYDLLTKPVDMTEDGRPLSAIAKARSENPIDFEIKLHTLFALTDGFKDFSSFYKTTKSKATQEFINKLNSNTLGKEGSLANSANDTEFMKALDKLDKAFN
jgi:hypothetical protein